MKLYTVYKEMVGGLQWHAGEYHDNYLLYFKIYFNIMQRF